MHASSALLLAIATLATAQQSNTNNNNVPVSGCGSSIDLIIQSCLSTLQPQLAACSSSDYDCLCTQSQNVLTCYNNCMTDPNRFGALSTNTAYCAAADTYGSAASSSMTRTGTATANPTASPGTNTTSPIQPTPTSDDNDEDEAHATNSSSEPSESGSAGNSLVVPAGWAVVLGLVAVF